MECTPEYVGRRLGVVMRNRGLRLVIVVAIIVVFFELAKKIKVPDNPAPIAYVEKTENTVLSPDQLRSNAIEAIKSGDGRTALVDLSQISGGSSNDKEFVRLMASAKKASAQQDIQDAKRKAASELLARKNYADVAEQTYLSNGKDVVVRAQGKDATVLHMKYIFIGRPFVYQFQNDYVLVGRLQHLGFKKAILTDGYGKTWTVPLD